MPRSFCLFGSGVEVGSLVGSSYPASRHRERPRVPEGVVPTPSECMVIANSNREFPRSVKSVFITYDNGAWSPPTTLTGTLYYGIYCWATTDCTAVGLTPPPPPTVSSPHENGLPAIAKYDGRTWTPEPQIPGTNEQTGGLSEVTCVRPDFCIATDESGDVIETMDARVKIAQPFPGDTDEIEVSCANPSLCVAFNGGGGFEISVFDGSGWKVESIDPTQLTAIGCSTDRCYAGDTTGDVYWTSGGSWSKPTKIGSSGIASIGWSGSSFCMAATNEGDYMTMSIPEPD